MKFSNNNGWHRLLESREQSDRRAIALACVALSDTIFKMNHVMVRIEKIKNPRHERNHQEETIFLPDRHFTLPIFENLKSIFGEEDYARFIAYHEFGHAAQVACLDPKNSDQVQIKGSPSLNYLFNGAAVPDRINNLLKELFKEGFADCYAGLCLYKETGDVQVFSQISKVRFKRYTELKADGGSDYIHPNFNVTAAESFGMAVSALMNQGKDIFTMPFTGAGESVEGYIERAVIAGCLVAVVKELRTNDAFLSQCRRFARGFGIDPGQVRALLPGHPNIDQVVAYEKEHGMAPFFLEFRNRLPKAYAGVLPDQVLSDLLTHGDFKRSVGANLVLMDVVAIPYTSGLEQVKRNVVVLRAAQELSEGRSSLPTGVPKLK